MPDRAWYPDAIATDARLSALADLSARLEALPVDKALTHLVDTVDARLLPHLAHGWHLTDLEGWRLADSTEKRRALLRRAIALHRKKGTVWAVKRALEILNVSAELTEWWQTAPRGAPYTFELTAWANDNLSDDDAVLSAALYARLRRLVEEYKPVRSHFGFRVGARFDAGLAAANGSQAAALGRWTGAPVAVQPPPAAHPLRAASAARSLTVIRISMEAR